MARNKAAFRRQQASLPFEEKLRLLVQMQHLADDMGRMNLRPWNLDEMMGRHPADKKLGRGKR